MKIVFSGGGTLGHVIPAMSVIKALKESDRKIEIIYLGSCSGLEKDILKNNKDIDSFYAIDVQGLKRSVSLKNITTFIRYNKAQRKIKGIYKQIKPDLVIGMGGYVSLVAVKVAQKMKIKTMIHEQNSTLGLSNRLVIKKASKVLLTFEISKYQDNKKVKVIGNPRTSEINQVYRGIKLIEKRQILVVGGSRGADKINDIIIRLADQLLNQKIKVVLITGKKYYQQHRDKIKNTVRNGFSIIPFTDNLVLYMMKSELIVTRSGATTLAEIIGLKKPAILIPSPNVTANHQYYNALNLVNNEAALMIEEKNLQEDRLLKIILEVINNPFITTKLVRNLHNKYSEDALELFIAAIRELVYE